MADYWQVTQASEAMLRLATPDGQHEASAKWDGFVKWDGCVELCHDDEDIHICDVADLIARLQALQALAEAHFGTWPG